MSPRTSVILVAVAVLFGAAVLFFERPGEEAAQEGRRRVFAGLAAEPSRVSSIALTTDEGAKVRLERRGGRWWVVEPIEAPANDEVVESLAETLVQMESEAVIASPQAPPVYGLDDESRIVRFVVDGAQRGLRLGGRTPVGSNSYVSPEGNDAVFVIPTRRVEGFSHRLDGLRDARVIRFDASQVRRVTADHSSSVPVVLERDDTGWRIAEPIEARANAAKVEGLLSTLSFLRATAFVDRPDAADEAALAVPESDVILEFGAVPGSPENKAQSRLLVAPTSGGGERLVRGDRRAVFRVEAERLFELPSSLNDFRVKELSSFDPNEVAFYEAVFRPPSGGAITVGMERSAGGWKAMTPEAMAAGAPSRALAALADLQAKEIVAEAAGPVEWMGLGLQPAAVTYRVYGDAGDDARPRLLAEVNFGDTDLAKGTLARRAGDPRLYRIAPGLGRHLPLHYGAFVEEFRSREGVAPSDP